MAVGDYSAVFTHGWFPEDGLVPGPAEVFTHGWFRVVVIITSAPNIITFTANSGKTLVFTANSGKTLVFTVKEIL